MSSLSIHRVDKEHESILIIEGSLDETCTLRWGMFKELRSAVRIHLRGVSRMNSCGVREWIEFVTSAPDSLRIEYEQCSVAFMKQMNTIANFLGRGELRSFMLPLSCRDCEYEVEQLVTREQSVDIDGLARTVSCPRCKHSLEADFVTSAFLRLQRPSVRESTVGRPALLEILRSLFQTAENPVALVDRERQIVYSNDAWKSLLMVRPHAEAPHRLDDVIQFEIDGNRVDLLAAASDLTDGTKWREVRVPQLPESNFLVEMTHFQGAGGHVITLHDLTLEASLHRKYRALWTEEAQSRVLLAERNRRLQDQNLALIASRESLEKTTEELRQAQASMVLAERLTAMAQLSGALAHEMSNPAAAAVVTLVDLNDRLRLLTELQSLIARRPPDATLASFVQDLPFRRLMDQAPALTQDALEASRVIANLTRDLKAMMNSGRAEHAACDVNTMLGTTLRFVQSELMSRARLVRDLGPVPPVLADESRLTQVFINLLMNATQAIGPETTNPEIRVSSAVRAGRVVVTISDNGVGMTDETLARIFEPFFTTKPAGGGTGLGLSLVRKVLEEIGGSVHVDSAPARGTTVTLTMVAAPSDRSQSDPRQSDSTGPSEADRRRVLIVDDDSLVLRSLGRILSRSHDVTLAESAAKAIGILSTGARHEVVLVDLMLPGLSGIELIEIMEKQFPAAAKQIMVMTGGSCVMGVQKFLQTSHYPVLEKPIEPDVLLEAIAHITMR